MGDSTRPLPHTSPATHPSQPPPHPTPLQVLLEGPQSFWLSNAAEKFWDSGTSANTGAAGMLAASRMNVAELESLVINIHKTPGSSRVGGGANPCAFVPQNYFNDVNGTKEDFDKMGLVSQGWA